MGRFGGPSWAIWGAFWASFWFCGFCYVSKRCWSPLGAVSWALGKAKVSILLGSGANFSIFARLALELVWVAFRGRFGCRFGPKLGPKSHPKRLRKPCRKRGPQKHPTGPENWASMGPTWPPKGHQIRPKISQNACRSLTGTPSCWKHAILAPPGPLQDPSGALKGSFWSLWGPSWGLFWGGFGPDQGSIWGLSWLRFRQEETNPKEHNASPINDGTAPRPHPPKPRESTHPPFPWVR